MSKNVEEMTYLEASQELQQIVEGLQRTQDIDVDVLMEKVDRAKQLIEFCGQKIKKAEVHVKSVLDELRTDGPEEEVAAHF